MSRAMPLLLAVVGVVLLSFVLYNVEVGLYYFAYQDSVVHYKMEIPEILFGDCSKEVINADLSAHRSSECLSPLGTYRAVDMLIALVGVTFSFWAPVLALKQSGRLKAGASLFRYLARIRMVLGASLVAIAVGDLTGIFSADGSPMDWEALFGIPLPPMVMDLLLIVIGVTVIRRAGKALNKRGKKRNKQFREPWMVGDRPSFKGSLEKREKGGVMTVGDLRNALSLDQYEDIFQVATSDGADDMVVGRKCHYCNGLGCVQCDYAGEFF